MSQYTKTLFQTRGGASKRLRRASVWLTVFVCMRLQYIYLLRESSTLLSSPLTPFSLFSITLSSMYVSSSLLAFCYSTLRCYCGLVSRSVRYYRMHSTM